MKKNIITFAVVFAAFISLLGSASFAEQAFSKELQEKIRTGVVLFINSPKAFQNSRETVIDSTNASVYPFIKDGRTLVPVRFISESLGAKVDWDEKTSTVTFILTEGKTAKTVKLAIGSNVMSIGESQELELDVPAQIVNGRTFIPLRALVEALGKKVFWDDRGLIVISDVEEIFNKQSEKSLVDELTKYMSETKDTIFSIDGKGVSLGEFRILFDAVKINMQGQGVENFDMLIQGKKAIEIAKDKALQSIIQYKLENQKAKKLNIALSQDEIRSIGEQGDNLSTQDPKISEAQIIRNIQ